MPQKFTIANFGDSFSSGEGAPNPAGPRWENTRCHRSVNSGQVRAVDQLIKDHPSTAFAFKNVACSGAELQEGIIEAQQKPVFLSADLGTTPVTSQITQVKNWLIANGNARLNIAMVSGGGNDVGFAYYVGKYWILPLRLEMGSTEAVDLRNKINQNIPGRYETMKRSFDAAFEYDKVLISEYPAILHGANGVFCESRRDSSGAEIGEGFVLNEYFLAPINAAIANAATAANATFTANAKADEIDPPNFSVVKTTDFGRNHGLCNDSAPYFNNNVAVSRDVQGDPYGTVHPNRTGHENIYLEAYNAPLRKALLRIKIDWARIRAVENIRAKIAEMERRQREKLLSAVLVSPIPPSFPKTLTTEETQAIKQIFDAGGK